MVKRKDDNDEEVSNHGRKWNEKRKIQLVPGHE